MQAQRLAVLGFVPCAVPFSTDDLEQQAAEAEHV